MISALDDFESIRYPDLLVAQGMHSDIGRGKPSTSPSELPRYTLQLSDIDELIDKVFTAASIGHKAFTSGLHPPARQYLIEENVIEAWKQS